MRYISLYRILYIQINIYCPQLLKLNRFMQEILKSKLTELNVKKIKIIYSFINLPVYLLFIDIIKLKP